MPEAGFYDIDTILKEARDEAGLQDFGSDAFMPGLEALLETYTNSDFTDKGHRSLRRRAVKLLIARLNIEETWKKHPEIRELPIKNPMFLTGLPRTGTSALLNILSNDPATRTLALWEGYNPWPIDLAPGEEDPRYLAIKAHYEKLNSVSDFKKMHHSTADNPEECIHLTNHTFQDAQFGFEVFMEPYATFYQQTERQTQYQYHADLLRMLHFQRPADRWLLKTPSHAEHLEIIVDMHPDCEIIITHRTPLQIIGSYCSLMTGVMPAHNGLDLEDLGARVLEFLGSQTDKCMAQRDNISSDRILDLDFHDILDKPQEVVERIYSHFKLPLPDSTRDAIFAYIADHPKGKHGSHDYKLEQFGLTEQKVLDRFAIYIERFDIRV
jgi:hypothetical protein